MLRNSESSRFGKMARMPFTEIMLISCLLLLPLSLNAINLVHVDVGRTEQTESYDTIYIGSEFEFRIHIENDVNWDGFTMGFEIWSDDGVTWTHVVKPDGWGSMGIGSFPACFTVVPGSRMYPWWDIFDMTGLLVQTRSFEGITPDSFMVGGQKLFAPGCVPGDLEHMLSGHFKTTGPWSPGEVKEICIRHINFPNGGDFVYGNNGFAYAPDWTTPTCFPISVICGDANADMSVNLGDAGFIINYIFFDGLSAAPWQLADANGDYGVGMGDAGYIINYIFYNGPGPVCYDGPAAISPP